MSHAIMLRPGWPGTFHRSMRDEKGKILKTLEFQAGVPLVLTDEEFAAVKTDIGISLVDADVKEGVPTGKVLRETPTPAEAKKSAAAAKAQAKADAPPAIDIEDKEPSPKRHR